MGSGNNGTKTKSNYSCNKCEEKFDNKWEVMAHRKERHPSTVRTCKFFVQGICGFGN
jgi:DNA-directed RNA polymerase subunit RPC12/RpoP